MFTIISLISSTILKLHMGLVHFLDNLFARVHGRAPILLYISIVQVCRSRTIGNSETNKSTVFPTIIETNVMYNFQEALNTTTASSRSSHGCPSYIIFQQSLCWSPYTVTNRFISKKTNVRRQDIIYCHYFPSDLSIKIEYISGIRNMTVVLRQWTICVFWDTVVVATKSLAPFSRSEILLSSTLRKPCC